MMELDGRPVSAEELAGLGLRNYGHFTSMRVEDLRVRGLHLHLERLVRDCRILHNTNLDTQQVRHLVRQIAEGVPSPVVARVTVFDPHLDLGNPGAKAEPRILVSTRAAPIGSPSPFRLQSIRYQRELPAVKHTGLFGSIYHRRAAQLGGYDDVLFVNSHDQVSEGATWNIGFLDGSQVVWPKAECLPGVTAQLVEHLLGQGELSSITSVVDVPYLEQVEGAFITNAVVGVRPVAAIDNVAVHADLKILTTLQQEYTALPGEQL